MLPTAQTTIKATTSRARMNQEARRRVFSLGWVMPKVLMKAEVSASRSRMGSMVTLEWVNAGKSFGMSGKERVWCGMQRGRILRGGGASNAECCEFLLWAGLRARLRVVYGHGQTPCSQVLQVLKEIPYGNRRCYPHR